MENNHLNLYQYYQKIIGNRELSSKQNVYFVSSSHFCIFQAFKNYFTYSVLNEIDFPRHDITCSRENLILRGKFQVVSCFPLHFMLYRGNLDYFLDSVLQFKKN